VRANNSHCLNQNQMDITLHVQAMTLVQHIKAKKNARHE